MEILLSHALDKESQKNNNLDRFSFFSLSEKNKSFFSRKKKHFKHLAIVLCSIAMMSFYAKMEKNNYVAHFHQYTQSKINHIDPVITEALPAHYVSRNGNYDIQANPDSFLFYLNNQFEKKDLANNYYLASHIDLIMAPEIKISPEIKEALRQKMLSYGMSGADAEDKEIKNLSFNCVSVDLLCLHYENKFKDILLKFNHPFRGRITAELYNLSHIKELNDYNQLSYDERKITPTPYEKKYGTDELNHPDIDWKVK